MGEGCLGAGGEQWGAVDEPSKGSVGRNKRLDEDDSKWLDPREGSATGSADQGMATVGELDGA